jgi:hypothetical protein
MVNIKEGSLKRAKCRCRRKELHPLFPLFD